VIWSVQHGYVDKVPAERVKEFQSRLTDFLTTRKSELLARIEKEKLLSEALQADLKAATDEFQQTWQASSGKPAR
jgi:F-type H+-transporting ATPase subunit alpha